MVNLNRSITGVFCCLCASNQHHILLWQSSQFCFDTETHIATTISTLFVRWITNDIDTGRYTIAKLWFTGRPLPINYCIIIKHMQTTLYRWITSIQFRRWKHHISRCTSQRQRVCDGVLTLMTHYRNIILFLIVWNQSAMKFA